MAKELTTQDEDFGIDISDIMMIVMVMLMASILPSIATSTALTAQAVQAQVYQGQVDTRELNATSELKWIDLIHEHPYVGWSWAEFTNNGPDPVKIGINYPDETFTIASGGVATVDRLAAVEKINIVFYFCDPGNTAVVAVRAEY